MIAFFSLHGPHECSAAYYVERGRRARTRADCGAKSASVERGQEMGPSSHAARKTVGPACSVRTFLRTAADHQSLQCCLCRLRAPAQLAHLPLANRYPGPPRDPHPLAAGGEGSTVGGADTMGTGGADTMGAGGICSLLQLAHLPLGKRYPGPPREPHPSTTGGEGSTVRRTEPKCACGFC